MVYYASSSCHAPPRSMCLNITTQQKRAPGVSTPTHSHTHTTHSHTHTHAHASLAGLAHQTLPRHEDKLAAGPWSRCGSAPAPSSMQTSQHRKNKNLSTKCEHTYSLTHAHARHTHASLAGLAHQVPPETQLGAAAGPCSRCGSAPAPSSMPTSQHRKNKNLSTKWELQITAKAGLATR